MRGAGRKKKDEKNMPPSDTITGLSPLPESDRDEKQEDRCLVDLSILIGICGFFL
jgi:hypothetical protein